MCFVEDGGIRLVADRHFGGLPGLCNALCPSRTTLHGGRDLHLEYQEKMKIDWGKEIRKVTYPTLVLRRLFAVSYALLQPRRLWPDNRDLRADWADHNVPYLVAARL
jgi:hypothetical protein